MHNYLESMIKISQHHIKQTRRSQRMIIIGVLILIAAIACGVHVKAWFAVGVSCANVMWIISLWIEAYVDLKQEMRMLAYYEEDRFKLSHAEVLEMYETAKKNYESVVALKNHPEEKP